MGRRTAIRPAAGQELDQSGRLNLDAYYRYTTGGRGGRVSARTTKLNDRYTFTQSATWGHLGAITQETYPRYTTGGCESAATAGTLASMPYFDESQNVTSEQTAIRAYTITHLVYESAGAKFNRGCKDCILGAGVQPLSKVNNSINNIIRDKNGPYAEKIGKKIFDTGG